MTELDPQNPQPGIYTGVDLKRLADPFDPADIEWRVSRAGTGDSGIWCRVLAYITARAIAERLDEVCGPANWRNEPLTVQELSGVFVMQVGISIRIGGEWVTKWDVSEPTHIEPAKGGFSGAMKRAGAQWGIGRYLYHLEETFAEVSQSGGRSWNYARLPQKDGGNAYYWKPPTLPAWAVPKNFTEDVGIAPADLNALKRAFVAKFTPDSKDPAGMREAFARFVAGVVGEFPSADHTCWTRDALEKCQKQIDATTDPDGVSSDVPFEE